MFVTRMTLRGLTCCCGAFGIQIAMLVTILLYLPSVDYDDQLSEAGPSDEKLRRLMLITHTFLIVSTYCVAFNKLEGVVQQLLCYTACFLYIFMITEIVLEIYMQPPFREMKDNFNMVVRYLFLNLECQVFVAILISNFIFCSIRMLTPNQVTLIRIEPKKQMPSTDTIESLAGLMGQYQSFVVPAIVNLYLIS